jgi:hypothetical protein
MRDCKEQMTIWNKWRDPETGKDVFFRHVPPVRCKFVHQAARGMTGSGAGIAGSYAAVIPETGGYRPAEQWKQMDEEGRRAFFTLQVGDILARGAHDVEITGVKPYRESDVKALMESACMTVRVIQDNTESAHGKHLRVEGI